MSKQEIPGWPWRPDICPADLHYSEYLTARIRRDPPPKVVHVGTGLHHHVGLVLGAMGWTVIGLTVSQAEVDAFHLMDRRPSGYTAFLRDIRNDAYVTVGGGIADSMSLFHLGEPPAPQEGDRSDREVIEQALAWSREVVFYSRSAAFDRIGPLIAALVKEGRMSFVGAYKTLIAYRANA